jgi:hypothetical protein
MDFFLNINPLDKIIEKINVDSLGDNTQKILGSDIIELYRKYGISSFGKGLIQTIHPIKSQHILEGWGVPWRECYPILKSSFGTIYFIYKTKLGYLVPIYKEIEFGEMEIDLVFDLVLADTIALNNACFKDIHDQVYPRLGIVDNDEIYAFVPALALGGERSAKNVEKVKMKEHFIFLSQL